jgi:hypothetical protein
MSKKITKKTIVKPKTIAIIIRDKDNNIVDTISSRTLDYYQLKYGDLYNILEELRDEYYNKLEKICKETKFVRK